MTSIRATFRALSLALTSLLAVSCASAVDGSATAPQTTEQSSSSQRAEPYSWLTSVLPTGDDLSIAVGRRVRVDGIPPLLGGVNDLRNTVTGTDVTMSQCTATISPLEKQAYGGSPIRAVAYSTQSTITSGAVWLASESDARALFAALSDQWRRCDGTSNVSSTGGLEFNHEIFEVNSTADVVSAVVVVTSASGGVPVLTERALGVAKDCIVEAEVPVTAPSPGSPDTRDAAVELVKLMLTKVNTAPR